MSAEITDPTSVQELQATIKQQAAQIAELQAKLDLFELSSMLFLTP